MKKLSAIGLNEAKSEVVAQKLNVLLAITPFFTKTHEASIGTSIPLAGKTSMDVFCIFEKIKK